MEQLKLKNVLVCNPESRNIHNKIFGGWLMRQAFELGKCITFYHTVVGALINVGISTIA